MKLRSLITCLAVAPPIGSNDNAGPLFRSRHCEEVDEETKVVLEEWFETDPMSRNLHTTIIGMLDTRDLCEVGRMFAGRRRFTITREE